MSKPLDHSIELLAIVSSYLLREKRSLAQARLDRRILHSRGKVIPFPEPKGFGKACIDRAIEYGQGQFG